MEHAIISRAFTQGLVGARETVDPEVGTGASENAAYKLTRDRGRYAVRLTRQQRVRRAW
jgi:hypothetical protein